MMDKKNSTRIELLDGFRSLAIISVMMYHYLFRFANAKGLYPYGARFVNFTLARFGYTGVQLFFIISGFVIFLTLERSKSFKEFFIKRVIRLFPMLLFCSLTTFVLVGLLDSQHQFAYFHKTAFAFIPSLTFTEPALWQKLVNPNIKSFVDGVYWTLVIEMRFYILVALLYFFSRMNFFSNWTRLIFVVLTLHYAIYINNGVHHFSSLLTKIDALFDLVFVPDYIIYFSVGMFFFMLFKKRKIEKATLIILTGFVFAQSIVFLKGAEDLFFAAYIGLFLIFIYKPNWLKPLGNSVFQTLGLVSYPLYLLHQNIGVLAIHRLAYQTNTKGIINLVLVSALILILSYCLHQYIDQPLQKYFKKLLLKETKKAKESKTLPVLNEA